MALHNMGSYPVRPLINRIVTKWCGFAAKMLGPRHRDRDLLIPLTGIEVRSPIDSLHVLGDPHHGGRAVTVIEFADPCCRIPYGPRDVGTDVRFAEFMSLYGGLLGDETVWGVETGDSALVVKSSTETIPDRLGSSWKIQLDKGSLSSHIVDARFANRVGKHHIERSALLMGLFSRKRQAQPRSVIPPTELGRLASIGRSVYSDGQRVDVSDFYLAAVLAGGDVNELKEPLFGELLAAGRVDGGWALAGALYVAVDFGGIELSSATFTTLVDEAFAFMASVGVPGGNIPMGLLDRWSEARH